MRTLERIVKTGVCLVASGTFSTLTVNQAANLQKAYNHQIEGPEFHLATTLAFGTIALGYATMCLRYAFGKAE